MAKRFTLTTSGDAVRRLRKAYAAQGTAWPRGVRVVALPGNLTGNTMLVSRTKRPLRFMAMATGGTLSAEE
jgi:hypothetical protein